MDDITSMRFVGTLVALTHSILINLFIKLELNILLLPPPLSIVLVPNTFLHMFVKFYGYWKGLYFVHQHGVKRQGGRRWFFVHSVNKNSLGWKRDVITLRNSSCDKL